MKNDYSIISLEKLYKLKINGESDEECLVRITKEQGRNPIFGTFRVDRFGCGEYGGAPFPAASMECE